jgi:hypothetical protein
VVLVSVIVTIWVLATLQSVALCVAARRLDDERALDRRLTHAPRPTDRTA